MGQGDVAGPGPSDTLDEPSAGPRRLIVGAIGVGVVALVVVLVIRWFRHGGARSTVYEIAEAGAAALADVLVDELLPV